jgi:hypothetical protein
MSTSCLLSAAPGVKCVDGVEKKLQFSVVNPERPRRRR